MAKAQDTTDWDIFASNILYSRKYWQELNLAVGPKIAIAKILVNLNFMVR